ncbi:MAG: LacI family DNA-binding transcriptional regulator [Oscillospiraceae bacterium]|nr:LacI family DNA-binding transcriptional regulator [Oscillospiraceae bacterium]
MTIKDVARLAGVSVSTVSRVLNKHPDVSPLIREKVLEVVKEHHFIPNSTARNLVRPRRDAVGIICLGRSNPFYPPIISQIEEMLNKAGYSMCLRFITLEEDELTYAAELERAERLQGIVFLGGRSDYTVAETAALTVPYVCCSFTNYFGDVPRERYSSVTMDDVACMHDVVGYLYERGHREIGLLLPSFPNRSISELRYRGYCGALKKLELPMREENVLFCSSFREEDGYQAVKKACQKGLNCTALVAASDMLGVAAIRAMHEEGVRVPDDCSLISIDGLNITRYTLPAITTLVQPQKTMGEESVRLLLDMIINKSDGQHLIVTPTIRQGESVQRLN